MSKLKNLFMYLIPVLLLCSCAIPVSTPPAETEAQTSVPSETVQSSGPAVPFPSDSETTAEPSPSAETIKISPDKDGYELIPGSVPKINSKRFDDDKVYGYLAQDGCITDRDYWYTLDSAEIKDGKLYLSLSVNISFVDINTPYEDLRKKHSVPVWRLRRLPLFTGCVLHGGTMYADEEAWRDRRLYNSYKAWQSANNGFANCPEEGYLKELPDQVPVSENADIILFGFNDNSKGGYSRVTMQDFKSFVLDPANINDYGDGKYVLDNLYFKYSSGEISAVYQNNGDT